MRMPTLLSRTRPFRNVFRIASGGDPGSTPVVLLLVLWASASVLSVTAGELLGPGPAPT